jgi:hypothetical protein
MALKKHVDVNHVGIIKSFEEKVNGPIKGILKKTQQIKGLMC